MHKESHQQIQAALQELEQILGLPSGKLKLEPPLEAPHKPPTLPKGKMAVYIFTYKECFLKIGKAGPNSNARYSSQHYNMDSSRSNLAKSLVNDLPNEKWEGLTSDNVSSWIKDKTTRYNILMEESPKLLLLNLLEAFLHYRLEPEFEGAQANKQFEFIAKCK